MARTCNSSNANDAKTKTYVKSPTFFFLQENSLTALRVCWKLHQAPRVNLALQEHVSTLPTVVLISSLTRTRSTNKLQIHSFQCRRKTKQSSLLIHQHRLINISCPFSISLKQQRYSAPRYPVPSHRSRSIAKKRKTEESAPLRSLPTPCFVLSSRFSSKRIPLHHHSSLTAPVFFVARLDWAIQHYLQPSTPTVHR